GQTGEAGHRGPRAAGSSLTTVGRAGGGRTRIGQSRMVDRTPGTHALPHGAADAGGAACYDVPGAGTSTPKRLATAAGSSSRSRAPTGGRNWIARVRSSLPRVRSLRHYSSYTHTR